MTKLTESDAVRAAHHLDEASKYAFAIFWAQSLYKATLNEQFTKALKAAAEAAGYILVKAEEEEE
jgi:hypothetical protein